MNKKFSKRTFFVPIIIASLVGVTTGLFAVGFIKMVDLCWDLLFVHGKESLSFLGPYFVLLIPALGGLFVGPLVCGFAPEAKGHGVPEVLKAITVKGGRIRPRVVIVKALASILSLGSGFSVGREGPIVQIGSALGSSVGQLLKLNELRIKNLVACGAAAGIAAVFNAPIAGVMFASEVILRDFGVNTLSTVVVAAVSSSIISRVFLGENPAFSIPSYQMQSPWEIFGYMALGVLSAFAALLFIYVLRKTEVFWNKVEAPNWVKPVLGGLLIGLIGLYFPHIFGSGLSTIDDVLHGNLPVVLLLSLVVMKILATSISIGAGSSGGVFAPTLFIGAVLGGAIGQLFFNRLPFPVESSGAYALVGMASVFSAAAHAPVTAILIVFEMTNGYHLILPLMTSVVLATSISQLLQRESIYTINLKDKGIDIGFLQEARVLGGLQVKDAIQSAFETVTNDLPVNALIQKMSDNPGKIIFTVDKQGSIVGTIKYEEIQRILLEGDMNGVIAQDITVTTPEYCFAEEHLAEVAKRMAVSHLIYLPVVDPDETKKVVGVLRSEDILRAYSTQALLHADVRYKEQQESLFSSEEVISYSFMVETNSKLIGKAIKELDLPEGARFTQIKRGVRPILPQGSYVLKGKDRIWVSLIASQQDLFFDWLKTQQ